MLDVALSKQASATRVQTAYRRHVARKVLVLVMRMIIRLQSAARRRMARKGLSSQGRCFQGSPASARSDQLTPRTVGLQREPSAQEESSATRLQAQVRRHSVTRRRLSSTGRRMPSIDKSEGGEKQQEVVGQMSPGAAAALLRRGRGHSQCRDERTSGEGPPKVPHEVTLTPQSSEEPEHAESTPALTTHRSAEARWLIAAEERAARASSRTSGWESGWEDGSGTSEARWLEEAEERTKRLSAMARDSATDAEDDADADANAEANDDNSGIPAVYVPGREDGLEEDSMLVHGQTSEARWLEEAEMDVEEASVRAARASARALEEASISVQ
jgi:hypothetical protein